MAKTKKRSASHEIAVVDIPTTAAQMFERLARDKSVDVGKLERLIAMQERIMAVNARAAFEVAFNRLQLELPAIDKNGIIPNKDKTSVRATYAKLEDIHDVVKPICAKHGFSIRHRTEWPAEKPGVIRVVGILSHIEGHREESAFESTADKNDYRSSIQDQGSTVTYGRRYTTKDLLNITERGKDTDGRPPEPSRRRDARPPATAPPPARPPASSPPADKRVWALISDPQRKRLWVLLKKSGRDQAEFRAWLLARYRMTSTKEILREQYDAICTAIESPGKLPLATPPRTDREPGEEG